MPNARALLLVVILGGSIFLGGCTRSKAASLTVLTQMPMGVELDGTKIGTAPLQSHSLPAGAHALMLKPIDPSLSPYQHQLTFHPSINTVVHWNPGQRSEDSSGGVFFLEPLKGSQASEIFVTTVPENALVTLGTDPLGPAPLTRTLDPEPPEEQAVTVTSAGYDSLTYTLSFHRGYRTVAQFKLAKTEGTETTPEPSATPFASPASTFQPATNSAALVPLPRVLILSTGVRQDGVEGVRVRTAPNTASNTVGFAVSGQRYRLLGDGQSGWVPIELQGQPGWVSGGYVTIEK
jgi:hypothetical protein